MKVDKPLIVFLDRDTLPPELELRRPDFDHDLQVFGATGAQHVAERISNADIVITNKVPITEAAISEATRLRLIAVAATGYDAIDVAACRARRIAVANIRNYAVDTVPEHTFALILALRRNIAAYHKSVAAGRWLESGQFCYFDYPISNLAGSTLGIIGEGALGQSVATLARAFGMRPLFASHKGRGDMGPLYTPFEEVLRKSDVLTLHLPLLPSTRNLIGPTEFGQMERKPILINTSRGGLVDEGALVAALESGHISGAGFDVATTEPPPLDHPLMSLMSRPNFILTPHVAWAGREAIAALANQLIDNVESFWRGTPRNVVT